MKRIYPTGDKGVEIIDVPEPKPGSGMALCRLTYSLISTGTEKSMISRCEGKNRQEILDSGMLLGYCAEGMVEETRGDISVKPGSRVALYGGPYVSHSEFVAVPRHLLFPCPENINPGLAAFMGLGAISMHGFRTGKAGLGDVVLVAGAGLIGNLCAQAASLAGCRLVVSDPDKRRLDMLKNCIFPTTDIDYVFPNEVARVIDRKTSGRGADSVFLCMSTQSSQPMKQAVEVIRPGGTIAILGALDVKVPREPFFYKEPLISISRAAGPGRYDPVYERDSIDYPLQYVRWTEGRNLEETLKLISQKRLRVAPMISGYYTLDQMEKLYTKIMSGDSQGLGYIIQW